MRRDLRLGLKWVYAKQRHMEDKFKRYKNGKFESRYSEAFKRKVIEEYLETGTPKQRLLIKYGITYYLVHDELPHHRRQRLAHRRLI